jgi:hypothetical protein
MTRIYIQSYSEHIATTSKHNVQFVFNLLPGNKPFKVSVDGVTREGR